MAYNADNAPELASTLYRDGEWFRINSSRSGTPVTQETKTVLVDDVTYCPITKRSTNWSSNAPLRREMTAADHALDSAAATMRALLLAPGSMRGLPQGPLPPMERVTKTGMHGGAGVGERRLAPKQRQQRVPALPDIDTSRYRYGHKRVDETNRVRVEPVNMHAVAAQAVARGIAEIEALAEARRLADERRYRA